MTNVKLSSVVFLVLLCAADICCDKAFSADVTVRAFLAKHCQHCHGSEKQEADVRLDTLATPTVENDLADEWSRVLDMVEAGEMPPEDEPRPSDADVRQFEVKSARSLSALPRKGRLRCGA